MAKKLQLRRGTTTQHNSFTGAEGEVTVDTTKDSLVVHDGSTQGGHPIAKSSDIPSITGKADLAGANFTGNVLIDNAQELRLGEADGSGTNYTALKAQAQSGDITLTLPAVAPTANQVLKADASTPTNLTWATDAATDATKMPLAGGTFTGNVNAGVDDTGVDVKFFGATAGAYVLWDESADSLLTGGGATIDIVKDKLKIGGTAVTTTAAELNTLDGFTGDKDDLIYAKDLKATGVTDTEFDYLDGVTSNIQTQLNAKGAGDATKAGTNSWTGVNSNPPEDTPAMSGDITIDFGASNNFKATLTNNAVFKNPSTEIVGSSGSIFIKQDGTGGRTASWESQFHWAGGTAGVPILTTTAGAVDRIDYICYEAGAIHCVATLDIKAGA